MSSKKLWESSVVSQVLFAVVKLCNANSGFACTQSPQASSLLPLPESSENFSMYYTNVQMLACVYEREQPFHMYHVNRYQTVGYDVPLSQRPAWLASMTTPRRQAALMRWQWDWYVEPSLPHTGRRLDRTQARSHGTQTGVALGTFIRHRSPSSQLRSLHVNPPATTTSTTAQPSTNALLVTVSINVKDVLSHRIQQQSSTSHPISASSAVARSPSRGVWLIMFVTLYLICS